MEGRKACGCVAEAHAHERERLGDAEAVGQTPAEERGIACGDEDAGPGEGVGGGDERAEVELAAAKAIVIRLSKSGLVL